MTDTSLGGVFCAFIRFYFPVLSFFPSLSLCTFLFSPCVFLDEIGILGEFVACETIDPGVNGADYERTMKRGGLKEIL